MLIPKLLPVVQCVFFTILLIWIFIFALLLFSRSTWDHHFYGELSFTEANTDHFELGCYVFHVCHVSLCSECFINWNSLKCTYCSFHAAMWWKIVRRHNYWFFLIYVIGSSGDYYLYFSIRIFKFWFSIFAPTNFEVFPYFSFFAYQALKF